MPSTAKLFMIGGSQAVRLPKEFHFDGSQVKIRREGNAVILEPISDDWEWLDALPDTVDDDFVANATESRFSKLRGRAGEGLSTNAVMALTRGYTQSS